VHIILPPRPLKADSTGGAEVKEMEDYEGVRTSDGGEGDDEEERLGGRSIVAEEALFPGQRR